MTMDEYMNALLSDEVMNEERSIFKKARDYGREEGIGKGISIGKKARNVEVAKELLKMNLFLEKISAVTGLSKEEIKKMRNSQIK